MKKWFRLSMAVYAALFSINSFAGVKVVAHRGGSLLAPENTLAAFKNAIALKADYIELDVQLSSDDSLMIMHDGTIDRTTNGTGGIRTKTYAQLKTYDAGSKFSSAFAGEKIPTLHEVFAAVVKSGNTTIGLAPEFKSSESNVIQLVVAAVQKWNMQSRTVLSSFNLNQLVVVKNLDPTIRVQVYGSANTSNIDGLKAMGGEWIGSDVSNKTIVDYAHSKGIIFNSWTINSASQMLPLIAMGVDGIISDDPKTLIAVSDTSAPTDVVLNTPVVAETKITLTWQPAEDAQSGISNYFIYRDGTSSPTTLYAAVGNVTAFVVETYTENQLNYFRVKARNTAGITSANYSNEVSAATGSDVTSPIVSYVSSSNDSSTVIVEFSERVDKTTAEASVNYSLDKSAIVLNAKLTLDQKQVLLTTSPLADTTYTLTVKNVKDKAITQNTITESTPIFRHQNLSANIVASYSVDELKVVGADTLIIDASANTNNGVANNGPEISEGYLGDALEFDGIDDYVQFQPSPSFDLSSGLVSLSVWTKLNYLPADLSSAYGPIFDSETDNYVIYEDRGNNELRFKAATSGGAARPGIKAADLKTGEWIHVVGVYDGTNAMIFMNGILKGTLPLTGTVNKGQSATLGKSGTSFFSGKIDNVQIFNKALSYQEVSALYANTKSSPIITAIEDDKIKPDNFELKQNYPNPFNPETKLSYKLPVTGKVSLKIFDILGREVATLVDEVKEAGAYDVSFNGKGFASGAYFYRFQTGNFVKIKKMILLR